MTKQRLYRFWNGLLKRNIKWVRLLPQALLTNPVARSMISNNPRAFLFFPDTKKDAHADWYISQCVAQDMYCETSEKAVKSVIEEVIQSKGNDPRIRHTIHLMTTEQLNELFKKGRREYMLSLIPFEQLPVPFIDRYVESEPDMLYLIKVRLESHILNPSVPDKGIDNHFINNLHKASYLLKRMADLSESEDISYYRKQYFFDEIASKILPVLEDRLDKKAQHGWDDNRKGIPIYTQIVSFLMDIERLFDEWKGSEKLNPVHKLKDRYISFEKSETISIINACEEDYASSHNPYEFDINRTL